eukprot:scaffold311502_cov17-Tisochrysis_lutea.AAC.1
MHYLYTLELALLNTIFSCWGQGDMGAMHPWLEFQKNLFSTGVTKGLRHAAEFKYVKPTM